MSTAAGPVTVIPLADFGSFGAARARPGKRPSGYDERKRRRRYEDMAQYASATLAGFLRSGRSLTDAIDLVLDDPTYNRHVQAYRAAARSAPAKGGATRVASRLSKRAQGRDASALKDLEEVDRLAHAIMATSERLGRDGTSFETSMSAPQREANLLWFLDDPRVPGFVAGSLLAISRWDVAAAAMQVFYGGDSLYVPPVSLVDLARVARGSLRQYAARYASMPGSDIPESVVPAEERVNLATVHSLQRDAVAALDDISAAG